jgi:NAD(P)-dependent dehydrogenase (short-subunit alcohol dehydrogenase family)
MKGVVIITGASSGVGAATADALAAAGYGVMLNARRPAELAQVASRLPPERAALLVGDCSLRETAEQLVRAALARFGRLDAIVNNAGIAERHPIEHTSEPLLQRSFATNVFGPALLIAAAWPALCASGRGVVVNVSSMAAVDPFDGFFVYGASKAALESFTRSISREGRKHGVEAYNVRLGAIETPLLRSLFDEATLPPADALPPQAAASVIAECITGARRADEGGVISVLSERT